MGLRLGWAAAVALGLPALAVFGCNTGSGKSPASGSTGGTSGGSTGGGGGHLVARQFTTVDRGDLSFIFSAEDDLATTQADFAALWKRHAGPTSPPPQAGFPSASVIATFEGAQAQIGASTEVIRVEQDTVTGDFRALVRDGVPGSWAPIGIRATTPFHVVATEAAPAGAKLAVVRERLLDFDPIDAGSHSLIGQNDPSFRGGLFVLRTEPDFAAFWARHSAAPEPRVDFTQDMVVAVLAGFIPRFGNRVETRRMVHDPAAGEMRIDFVVHPYRGGAAPPQVDETPYQILRTPRAFGTIRGETRVALAVDPRAAGANATYAGPQKAIVVRDLATFNALVATVLPGGAAPAIDFNKEQAIFALSGPAAPRYSIQVAKVELLEDGEIEIEVHTQVTLVRPGGALASHFQVVAAPLTYGPSLVRFVDVTPVP